MRSVKNLTDTTYSINFSPKSNNVLYKVLAVDAVFTAFRYNKSIFFYWEIVLIVYNAGAVIIFNHYDLHYQY